MDRTFFYLLFLLLSSGLYGQYQIQGKITDSTTGEPLAFANVIFNENPNLQTSSDINGHFSFASRQNITRLKCSYVGYLRVEMEVDAATEKTIHIALAPNVNTLNEVIIHPGENPADRIIRKVIANKKMNDPKHIASFKYQSYNKLWGNLKLKKTVGIDTLAWNNFIKGKHLFFMENVTERRFLAPDNSEETIIASRVSGFKDIPFASVATDMQPFAFYEDNIKLLNVHYLNPISKGSLKKYNFRIEETLHKENDTVFVISFKPKKNKNFDGLQGLLYINSNRYAIQNVIASAYEKSSISLKIQQQYQWVDQKYWFPEQLNYTLTLEDFSRFKGVSTMMEGESYISKISMGIPLKKKDFPLETVHIAKDATAKDSLFWNKARYQKLNGKEMKTYRFLDSIGQKKHFDQKINLFRKLADNKIPVSFLDIDLSKTMQFNEYEGVRFGTGIYTNEKLFENFVLGGFGGYGQQDHQSKYGMETYWQISKKNEFKVGFRHQNNLMEIGQYGIQQYQNRLYNFRTFMGSQFDQIKQNTGLIEFRALRYLKCLVAFNQTNSKPLYPENPLSPVITPTAYRNTDASVFMRFAFKEKIVQLFETNYSSGTTYPILYAYISKGFKDVFHGDLNYWKIELAAEQTVFTKNIGQSHYRIETGYADHDLPAGLLFTGEGSYNQNYPFTSKHTFQTMTPYEFIADQYANAFLSHNFQTLLFKTKILQPNLSIHQNTGWGRISKEQHFEKTAFKTQEKVFLECGLQVDNLIKINIRNLGYLGLGTAVFYRYGYYALPEANDNIAYKATLNFTIK